MMMIMMISIAVDTYNEQYTVFEAKTMQKFILWHANMVQL